MCATRYRNILLTDLRSCARALPTQSRPVALRASDGQPTRRCHSCCSTPAGARQTKQAASIPSSSGVAAAESTRACDWRCAMTACWPATMRSTVYWREGTGPGLARGRDSRWSEGKECDADEHRADDCRAQAGNEDGPPVPYKSSLPAAVDLRGNDSRCHPAATCFRRSRSTTRARQRRLRPHYPQEQR